jgi:hypothetical protein
MKKTKLFLPAMAVGLLLSMGLTACNQPANNSQGNQSTNSQQSTQQKERITVTAAGDKKSLALNETVQLTAKVGDAVIEGVTWSSSDTAIVTVDETGKVTAVGYGEASITAKKDGYNNGTIGINVPRPAASATFDLTTAAEHYSADGWWELGGGGMFAMQTVNGWNPVAQTMSWGQTEEEPETFIGGFGTGDKETVKFTASKAEKAELMLNIGNSDEAVLAEIMTIKLNGTAINLAGKTLEANPGQFGNDLVFNDLSLGNLDLAASNTLEFEFLKDTNIFLNEVAVYAKEATVALTNPAAKQQIEVVENKLEVIVGQTVSIQVKNNLAGVSYASVDAETASVDDKGVVTGVKQGITNITVKKEGMYSVRVEITVKPAPVAGQILVEAEGAEELQAEEKPSGVMVQQDGGQWGGNTVHSGSAYVSFYGVEGELTLTYKFNAQSAATMVLSVVGSASFGSQAAYPLSSLNLKLNNASVTVPATAELPVPQGWSATMEEITVGDVAVKAGENVLTITLSETFPSLDVFKLSVK